MPGTPNPIIGPLGAHWTAVLDAIKAQQQQTAMLVGGAVAGTVVDRWGNVVEVYGPNLAQTVTVGAQWLSGALKPGVQVSTGAVSGTAGRIKQQGLATGTVTLTKGSTAATLVTTISGTFTNGQQIGAANVSDPSTGTATPAITPGTTMTITGSAITLSQAAAETGTGLYAAACTFA